MQNKKKLVEATVKIVDGDDYPRHVGDAHKQESAVIAVSDPEIALEIHRRLLGLRQWLSKQ